MGWSLGWDSQWGRDIGYAVPAVCDYPGCGAEIDRGLAYVCANQEPYGGDGCGLFFCEKHRNEYSRTYRKYGFCERCAAGAEPFVPTADAPEWVRHKLTDDSWAEWRRENPDVVAALRLAVEPKP